MATPADILQSIPTAWRDHGLFAQWLVRRTLPCTVVDLGVDYGYSTFNFALPGIGFVYGIDSFRGDPQAGARDTEYAVHQTRKDLDLHNLTFIKGLFDEVAQSWTTPIDILHIDGFHSYDSVKRDYESWSRFLTKNGVILMHDTEVMNYGVKDLFEEIDLPKVSFSKCYGLGIITRDEKLLAEIREVFAGEVL